jgi:hypothetical protein
MKRSMSFGAALCLAVGVAGCSGDDPTRQQQALCLHPLLLHLT